MIPVAQPWLAGNERKYVLECLDRNWLTQGFYVDRLEKSFAEYCRTHYAVTCSSGTAALHLALLACGVGPGDEVIVPDLTYVATANAVVYCGAKPVLVDIHPGYWGISPEGVERAITNRTRAVIAVHLYGQPCDMEALRSICAKHNLFLIEDAAEAVGGVYGPDRAGAMGDIAAFSFYGNKIITTGEGGMITTNDHDLAERVRLFRGQGVDPERRYWHSVVGYNYRLTDLQAAVGLAQLENVADHVGTRWQLAQTYRSRLSGFSFQGGISGSRSSYWMVAVVLDDPVAVARQMESFGIETRPAFVPMHRLPMYEDREDRVLWQNPFRESDFIADHALLLPTHRDALEQVDYIAGVLREVAHGVLIGG